MSTTMQDPMESVERRRAQLEENVAKLRQSLKHWATEEAEYDMLKKEIQAAKSPTPSQMLEIGRNLDAILITEKEVQGLLGNNQTKRTANQVVDMISKRVDYVQQNALTIEKQLEAAEKKLAGASILLEPDMENEEGLPFLDVQEELDEEGNVVSSSVLQPGKSAPDIVEVLRKAGVQRAEQTKASDLTVANGEPTTSTSPPAAVNVAAISKVTPRSTASKLEVSSSKPTPSKESVSFSEDTKPDPTAKKLSKLEATGYNDDQADYIFTKGTKVIEVDENENEIASYPIIPQGDSPEDAAIRRHMLQYGLSEVGQVVAEIDLDRRDQEYSDEEADVDYDEEYDSDQSEAEDKFGRSTRRAVTDDYRQQMVELEKKLNAQMMENIGPRPDAHPLAEYSDDVRTLKIRKHESFEEPVDAPEDGPEISQVEKKGVRFADNLDIPHTPQPPEDRTEISRPVATATPTMSDTIVERTGPTPHPPTATLSKSVKVSRFKSSRGAPNQPIVNQLPPLPVLDPQPFPRGPDGQTMAGSVIEHDIQAPNPPAPDEFDPVLVNREVQAQYNQMRNRMIQQQGGFKPSEEELEAPLVEEKDGKTKKVSRFRAARLKADGL